MRPSLTLTSDLYDKVLLCQVTAHPGSVFYPTSIALRLTDRSMNYNCSPYTHLSQEVCEHILDFLWDDSIALARCCMVCRGFLLVALQHLTDFSAPSLCSAETLVQFARALRAKQHWAFSKALFCLDIDEDPR